MWHEDQHLSWEPGTPSEYTFIALEVMFCRGDCENIVQISKERKQFIWASVEKRWENGVYIILSWSYNTITLTYENFQIASPAYYIAVTGVGDAWTITGRPMREGELTTGDQ